MPKRGRPSRGHRDEPAPFLPLRPSRRLMGPSCDNPLTDCQNTPLSRESRPPTLASSPMAAPQAALIKAICQGRRPGEETPPACHATAVPAYTIGRLRCSYGGSAETQSGITKQPMPSSEAHRLDRETRRLRLSVPVRRRRCAESMYRHAESRSFTRERHKTWTPSSRRGPSRAST